jgi:hypothetical protein
MANMVISGGSGDAAAAEKIRRRRLIFRGGLVAFWIALGVVLFVVYRGHTLLVDNRDVENPAIRAPDLITLWIDQERGLEFFRGDRDRFSLRGSDHRIRIEFSDGTPPFEGSFILPLKDDMYLLSVPKMLQGVEPFIEVFRTAPEPRLPEEEDIPGGDDLEGFEF